MTTLNERMGVLHRFVVGVKEDRLLIGYFMFVAMVYASSSLLEVYFFGWRQPGFDQYRLYDIFLSKPFPENVLQLENGHRPIVPNLVRIAEIHWFSADQLLQICVGITFLLLTAAIFVWSISQNKAMSLLQRWMCVSVVGMGLLWLGNARMLLHGNELVHTYLVFFCVTSMAVLTYEAVRRGSVWWIFAASAMAGAATFSFGPGIACFPALMVVGFVLRMPWRWQVVPILACAFCMGIYLFGLPGAGGVRSMLAFRPLESAVVAVRWLSGPWTTGWFGLGDPPLLDWLSTKLNHNLVGRSLLVSSQALTRMTGLDWITLSTIAGAVGVILFIAMAHRIHVRQSGCSRLEAVALTSGVFVVTTSILMGVGRLDTFQVHPFQVFADRYQVWPCLFWMSLLLMMIAGLRTNSAKFGARCLGVFVFVLPIVLWPTQVAWAAWGANVYQILQRSAAAARSDVFDPEVFPKEPDASREAILRTLSLLRRDRLSMFAKPGSDALGTHPLVSNELSMSSGVRLQWTEVSVDPVSGRPYARFQATVGKSALPTDDAVLAVLDELNIVVGLTASNVRERGVASFLSLDRSEQNFDGYVHGYSQANHYVLARLRDGKADILAVFPEGP